MAEYDDSNRGALWKNVEKNADHPNWPDYKGTLNASGIDYWLSAWLKKDKNGKPYMSLSIVPKETKGSKEKVNTPAKETPSDVDEDIPF